MVAARGHAAPPLTGRVVLDYKREPIGAFDLPLTVSSKTGKEEARLEAMLRLNPGADWNEIVARILRRGDLDENGRHPKQTKYVSGPVSNSG